MSVDQVVCHQCHGRGGYTLGPYPATKCNHCNGKGYVVVEAKASAPQSWPEALTPDLREVLGMMVFDCSPIAHAFRDAGHDIPRKAEDEQAFVLHWLVGLVFRHGSDWRKHAAAVLTHARNSVKP